MAIFNLIGCIVAAGFLLVGSALVWNGGDEEFTGDQERQWRYGTWSIFAIGLTALLGGILSLKEDMSGAVSVLYVFMAGLIARLCIPRGSADDVTEWVSPTTSQLNYLRLVYQCDSDLIDKNGKRFLGGLILTVIGSIVALFALGLRAPGRPEGNIISIIFAALTTGVAACAIFVTATIEGASMSATSCGTLNDESTFSDVTLNVSYLIVVWILTIVTVFSSSADVAVGPAAVAALMIGGQGIFSMNGEGLYSSTKYAFDDYDHARAGYVLHFIAFVLALIAIIARMVSGQVIGDRSIILIILAVIALAGTLLGSALYWRSIDDSDDDAEEKKESRYDVFMYWFVGFMALAGALIPKVSGILLLTAGGIIYRFLFTNTYVTNYLRLVHQCDKSLLDEQLKKLLAGGLFYHFAFLFAILALGFLKRSLPEDKKGLAALVLAAVAAAVGVFTAATSEAAKALNGNCSADVDNDDRAIVTSIALTIFMVVVGFCAIFSVDAFGACLLAGLYSETMFTMNTRLMYTDAAYEAAGFDDHRHYQAGMFFLWLACTILFIASIFVGKAGVGDAVKA